MLNFTNYKKMAMLEKEVKEGAKKDSTKEQAKADQPIINPGGLSTLLLTQGAIRTALALFTNETQAGVHFTLLAQKLH